MPHQPDASDLITRLEGVPFSRWHLRARVVVGSATFFDAFDALSLAFVLPVLVPLWGISAAQVGWLIAAGYFGQLVGALLFGGLAERFGRIRMVAGATALMSVMGVVCAMTWSFPSLLAARLVQGIGVGGEMPVAAVYINELSKAKGRGRFFLLYEMIFPVGLMMTGQIGAVVVPAFGWQVMFLIGGVSGLVITGLLLRLPESPRWLIGQGRLPEADAIVREIEASTHRPGVQASRDSSPTTAVAAQMPSLGATVADRTPTAATGSSRSRWVELLSPVYRGRTLLIWVLWACAYFITNGMNNWMPTLYNRVYGLSLTQSLRAGALNNVAQVLILLGCAFVIDRVGRRRWTAAGFVAGMVLLSTLGVFTRPSVTAVVVLVTLSYGIVGSINAVLYLYTPEIYPTRMRALGTGSATCWLRLSSAAGPLLVGYLVEADRTSAAFLMFAAAGLFGAVAATGMLETRNRRLEDIAP